MNYYHYLPVNMSIYSKYEHIYCICAVGNVLGVVEHVCAQVVLPDEGAVTQAALELLAGLVDEHVGLHVGLLGEGLLTHRAPVVLLTWKTTRWIKYNNSIIKYTV